MNSRALPLLLLTLTFACATHTQSTPPPRSADFTAELLTGEVLDANQFAKRIASFGKQTRLTIDRDETRGDERIVETTAEYARDAFGDEGEPITRTTRVRQRETWVKTASGWNVRHVEELGEITPDVAFLRVLNREGVAKARAQFDAAHPPSDSVLNNAAYKLLGSGRVDDAIEVFRMENEAYPQTINAWDSLAEAYVAAKENEKAIELYRRVLAATPTDDRVLGILRGLGVTISDDALGAMLRAAMPSDIELVPNVQYGEGSGRALRMHLLYSRTRPQSPRPAIVFIHGGGWTEGAKERGVIALIDFARRGFVGASIEYRLSGEAKFPAQIEDVQSAIRFLRTHANELGIDPHRIAVWGQSAGGHLAALAGTSGEGVTRPDAVIDWNGPTDFLEPRELARLLAQKKEQNAPSIAMERLLGGDVEAHRELAQQANPIRYVTRDDPPFLIMHGTADDAVDISQSRALVDALKAAGVDVTFKTYERESHFGIHPLRPVPKRFLEPMLEWLTRHLAMTSTSL